MSDSSISMIGLVLAIVGIPFTFFVSRYFANRKGMDWFYRERKVLDPVGGEFPDDVQIFLGGDEVTQLSEWSVGVWNTGNQSITSSEVVRQIELSFTRCQIRRISSVETSRDGIVATATMIDAQTCRIDFNFLDPRDGMSMSIYTEAEAGEADNVDINISGTVIGVSGGLRLVSRLRNVDGRQAMTSVIAGLITIALPLGLLYLGWNEIASISINEGISYTDAIRAQHRKIVDDDSAPPLFFGLVIGLMYIPLGCLFLTNAIRGYFSKAPDNVRRLAKERGVATIRSPFRRALMNAMQNLTDMIGFR